MNIRLALLPLALFAGAAFLPACGDKVADAKDAVSNFTADGASEMVSQLTDGLKGIDSLEDAKSAVEKLLPTAERLSKAKAALQDKMPNISGLTEVVNSLKTKFADKANIMEVLQPLLDQLKNLMS